MRRTIAILLLSLFGAAAAFAQTAPVKSAEDMLAKMRADMQSSKAEILGKNMSLSAEQAAKFWPAYDAYQKEQNVILDEQLKSVKNYLDHFETLDDATALFLLNAHFERDVRMDALRKKWLAAFQKILPTKLAVRAMQIDRRLSLAQQFEMSQYIPLSR